MATKQKQKPKTQNPAGVKLTCFNCGESKKGTDFYMSYHAIHSATKRLPYCKDCLTKMATDSNGNIIIEKLKDTLEKIDRPFLYDYWQISVNENPISPFGAYMKNLATPQNRNLTWSDSMFEPQAILDQKKSLSVKMEDFVVTDEMYEKWNYGYQKDEYYYFEKKYNQLKNNYPEKTSMHTEALLNYVRYRVKEELATARGDVKEAKEWGGLATGAATAAKINPSQLSAADLADGLSTFGQLGRAVEQAVDIISILPRFKEKPQDKADFTLWCYINYVRELKGLPPCEYKDIYQFYETRKKEYEDHIMMEEEADEELEEDIEDDAEVEE